MGRLKSVNFTGIIRLVSAGLLAVFTNAPLYCQPLFIRQLRHEMERNRTDSIQVTVYNKLAYFYVDTNLDSALYYVHRSMAIGTKRHGELSRINSYVVLGTYYERLPDYPESLANYQQALTLGKKYHRDSTKLIKVLSHMAVLYNRQGNYNKAIQTGLYVERFYETHSLPRQASSSKSNQAYCLTENELSDYKQCLGLSFTAIASAYSQLGNNASSLTYMTKQKELFERYHDLAGTMAALGNIGAVLIRMQEYNKAQQSLREALKLSDQVGNDYYLASCLDKLGEASLGLSQFKRAIDYHQQAFTIWTKMKSQVLLANCALQLGKTYLALGQYPSALQFTQQARAIFRRTSTRSFLEASLETLSKIQEESGRYQEALTTYREARKLKDSLTDMEKVKAVAQTQASFDLERKQQQIVSLHKDLTIQKLQEDQRQKQLLILQSAEQASDLETKLLLQERSLNQSQLKLQKTAATRQQLLITRQQQAIQDAHRQRLLYGTILLLLLLLVGIIFYNFRRQARARKLLIQQKNVLTRQAHQLEEVNSAKDKLFSLISHDLRSPVSRLKFDLFQLHTAPLGDADLSLFLTRIESQVDKILDLLTNLLDWSHSQMKGFQTLHQPIDLADLVADSVMHLRGHLQQKNIMLINHVEANASVMTDKYQLNAVIRNLLSNAIKFTPEGGYIRLNCQVRSDQVELLIRDTGIGMTPEQINELFVNPQVRKGTQGEQGTGLGLLLIQELLQKLNGSLQFESDSGHGTTARLVLPKD